MHSQVIFFEHLNKTPRVDSFFVLQNIQTRTAAELRDVVAHGRVGCGIRYGVRTIRPLGLKMQYAKGFETEIINRLGC